LVHLGGIGPDVYRLVGVLRQRQREGGSGQQGYSGEPGTARPRAGTADLT
jgi:hypothetical protein